MLFFILFSFSVSTPCGRRNVEFFLVLGLWHFWVLVDCATKNSKHGRTTANFLCLLIAAVDRRQGFGLRRNWTLVFFECFGYAHRGHLYAGLVITSKLMETDLYPTVTLRISQRFSMLTDAEFFCRDLISYLCKSLGANGKTIVSGLDVFCWSTLLLVLMLALSEASNQNTRVARPQFNWCWNWNVNATKVHWLCILSADALVQVHRLSVAPRYIQNRLLISLHWDLFNYLDCITMGLETRRQAGELPGFWKWCQI